MRAIVRILALAAGIILLAHGSAGASIKVKVGGNFVTLDLKDNRQYLEITRYIMVPMASRNGAEWQAGDAALATNPPDQNAIDNAAAQIQKLEDPRFFDIWDWYYLSKTMYAFNAKEAAFRQFLWRAVAIETMDGVINRHGLIRITAGLPYSQKDSWAHEREDLSVYRVYILQKKTQPPTTPSAAIKELIEGNPQQTISGDCLCAVAVCLWYGQCIAFQDLAHNFDNRWGGAAIGLQMGIA
jgi:hypothetical protein